MDVAGRHAGLHLGGDRGRALIGPPHLWLDTDAGVDDALALVLALALAPDALVGVSSVGGNVPAGQAAANARHVLDAHGGAHVPVWVGAEPPPSPTLDALRLRAAGRHGPRGLGPHHLPPLAADGADEGARALLAASARAPLTVVALGPCTTLATALRLDPTLPRRLARVVLVAGLHDADPGPDTNTALDPHAARAVVAALRGARRLEVLPLAAGRAVPVTGADLDALLALPLLGPVLAPYVRAGTPDGAPPRLVPHDALAVLAILADGLVEEAAHHGAEVVDASDGLARLRRVPEGTVRWLERLHADTPSRLVEAVTGGSRAP